MIPTVDAMAPNRGARWADTGGIPPKVDVGAEEVDFRSWENSFSALIPVAEAEVGRSGSRAAENDRSQMDIKALP